MVHPGTEELPQFQMTAFARPPQILIRRKGFYQTKTRCPLVEESLQRLFQISVLIGALRGPGRRLRGPGDLRFCSEKTNQVGSEPFFFHICEMVDDFQRGPLVWP
jgi:hypothetical protein